MTPEMNQYTIWNPADGRVLLSGQGVDVGLDAIHPGAKILRGVQLDARRQYVDPVSETPADRPSLALSVDKTAIAADGADTSSITGVPIGATVTVAGETHTVDDGVVEFSTLYPGDHWLSIDAFPAQSAEVLIHAT